VVYWFKILEYICSEFQTHSSFVLTTLISVLPRKFNTKSIHFIYELNVINFFICVYIIGILMVIQNYLLDVFEYNNSLQITNNYWYNHSITDIISRCIIWRYENCFLSLNGGKISNFHCDHAPAGLVLNNRCIPHIYFTLETRKW